MTIEINLIQLMHNHQRRKIKGFELDLVVFSSEILLNFLLFQYTLKQTPYFTFEITQTSPF